STGALFDLKPLAQLCRERGILLAVDAAQAAGAIPVDLHDLGVDYYAFPGQKWLMGPSGTGGFYARADRLAETLPAWIGTGAVASHDDLDDFELWADGRRFEGASTANLAAYAGLAAAVNWLLDEVGAEWACGRAARLADRAIAGLLQGRRARAGGRDEAPRRQRRRRPLRERHRRRALLDRLLQHRGGDRPGGEPR